MGDDRWLAERFEEHRDHLRAVAYRMLGSFGDADDALQEAWLRVSRADTSDVHNMGGWLTTVVGRVCLNMLRSRASRREDPLDGHVPDPIVSRHDSLDPAEEVMLADTVGLALLVVLEMLPPAERLAFVLHDMFGVPFDEIAPIVGRSTTAARQLASRGRRRVQGAAPAPESDRARQRAVVDAFFAAARHGDFEALVAVLDPEVVLRSDSGALATVLQGAKAVASQAIMFAGPDRLVRAALVNGRAGVVITIDGQPIAVMGFTVVNGKIIAIDSLGDPERLSQTDLSAIQD